MTFEVKMAAAAAGVKLVHSRVVMRCFCRGICRSLVAHNARIVHTNPNCMASEPRDKAERANSE